MKGLHLRGGSERPEIGEGSAAAAAVAVVVVAAAAVEDAVVAVVVVAADKAVVVVVGIEVAVVAEMFDGETVVVAAVAVVGEDREGLVIGSGLGCWCCGLGSLSSFLQKNTDPSI